MTIPERDCAVRCAEEFKETTDQKLKNTWTERKNHGGVKLITDGRVQQSIWAARKIYKSERSKKREDAVIPTRTGFRVSKLLILLVSSKRAKKTVCVLTS